MVAITPRQAAKIRAIMELTGYRIFVSGRIIPHVSTDSPPAIGSPSTVAPDHVRFRPTWAQRTPVFFLPFVVFADFANPLLWASPPGMSGLVMFGRVSASVLLVAVSFEVWLVGWWFGATLTGEALLVHSLRRRAIPWNRIAAVQVERFMGGQRVVVYEFDGRSTPLRMPSNALLSWDRAFPNKAAFIGHWWLTHRAV